MLNGVHWLKIGSSGSFHEYGDETFHSTAAWNFLSSLNHTKCHILANNPRTKEGENN
jgi:hypothetical protein